MEGGSGGGGGEVRRVNVVYFLSRDGRVEHPHLLRAHHHHCNGGVRLRDVKRWLSDLRGRDMPDFFSWSFKRRYKNGYIWQDVKNDDLITPVSDTEYVLKGSLIPPPSSTIAAKLGTIDLTLFCHSPSYTTSSKRPQLCCDMTTSEEAAETLRIATGGSTSPKPPPPIDADSPEPHRGRLQQEEGSVVGSTTKRASQMFRSILRCRAVETDDSALRPMLRPSGGAAAGPLAPVHHHHQRKAQSMADGGKGSTAGEKAVYKPAGAPNCAQCGKSFRPEKLHAHMQGCKALRVAREGWQNQSGEESAAHTSSSSNSSSSPRRTSLRHILSTDAC